MEATETPVNFDDDPTVASTEAAMREAGVPTHENNPVDYFAFDESFVVMLPDNIQWVEHTALNEGQKKKYQNLQNRDLIIQRTTGDAKMRMAPGDERHALLSAAITGWNLVRGGQPLPFNERNLKEFLEKAPPKIIELIEKDVRQRNPWLLAEMSVEDIDKEIANLEDMKKTKIAEDQGKALS